MTAAAAARARDHENLKKFTRCISIRSVVLPLDPVDLYVQDCGDQTRFIGLSTLNAIKMLLIKKTDK